MKINNDDVAAMIGTFIVHLILFFLLYYGVMRASPPHDDGSIPIFFDTNALAAVTAASPPPVASQSETSTPATRTPVTTPSTIRTTNSTQRTPTAQPTVKTPAPNNITQAKEETVPVSEATKQLEAEEKQRQQEAEERQRQQAAEEKQRQQEAEIAKTVSNSFSASNVQSNERSAEGAVRNVQRNPFPSQSSESYGSFMLDGRTIGGDGKLPRPCYPDRIDGKIVFDITVDPSGNVINYKIGKGTTIGDASMRECAINAVKSAKFNKIQGSNNQSGTITYVYKQTIDKTN